MRPTLPPSVSSAAPLHRRHVDAAQRFGPRMSGSLPPLDPAHVPQQDVDVDVEGDTGRPPTTWSELAVVALRWLVWPFVQVARGLQALAAEVVQAWRMAAQDAAVPDADANAPPATPNMAAAPAPATPPSPALARAPTPASARTPSTSTTASTPVPLPPSEPATPDNSGRNTLTWPNETAAQKAENRRRYTADMACLGTWGGEYELHVMAQQWNVRVQVFTPGVGHDLGAYVCSAVRGTPEAKKVANLHFEQQHYRALVHVAGERRVEGGAVCAKNNYRDVNVPGEGDCLFLAFAYAANVAHTRLLIDYLAGNAGRADKALRADEILAQQLDVDPAAHPDDITFAVAALNALVLRLRRRLVRELCRPHHTEQLNASVINKLADV